MRRIRLLEGQERSDDLGEDGSSVGASMPMIATAAKMPYRISLFARGTPNRPLARVDVGDADEVTCHPNAAVLVK